MNEINIIIPMAGAGSRFFKEGFKTAKPFIEFNGKMMVEHVLDSVNKHNATYYLIIKDEFKKIYKEQLLKIKSNYNVIFLSVEKLTQGASCTVLSAHKYINNNLPLIIIDSDNIYEKNIINEFINYSLNNVCDGGLLTFESNSPIYSYVLLNENKFATSIKEKEVISRFAICGAYFFKHGSDFVDSTINKLIYADKQKNEYYISGSYQYMIEKNKNILIYNIQDSQWNCVGTPEQLKKYLLKLK